jgi:hypothetical protein
MLKTKSNSITIILKVGTFWELYKFFSIVQKDILDNKRLQDRQKILRNGTDNADDEKLTDKKRT